MGSIASFMIILFGMSLIWGCASERITGGSGTASENEQEIIKAGKEISDDSESLSKDRPKDLVDLDQAEPIANRSEKLKEEVHTTDAKVPKGNEVDAKKTFDPREVSTQEPFSKKDENINIEGKVEDLNFTAPHPLLSESNHLPSEINENNSSVREQNGISQINEWEGKVQDVNDSSSAVDKNEIATSLEDVGDVLEQKPETVQINLKQGEEPVTNSDVENPGTEQNLILKQPSLPTPSPRKEDQGLEQSLGLSDAFSSESQPTDNQEKKATVSLSPAEEKRTGMGRLSRQQIRFSPSGKEVPDDGSPSTQRLGLKPALADAVQEGISGSRKIVFEDKKNGVMDSKMGTNRLRVGFSEKSAGESTMTESTLPQTVGFTNVIQGDADQISKDIENEPQPPSRESRGYANIRNFLGGVTSPSKSKQGYKQERIYKNLQDWSAIERDQNATNRAKDSQPKPFNRALKWIRQKGRVEE